MGKKKVLHIVEAFGGGIFSFLVDLINTTSDEYDITVCYSNRQQTPKNFKNYFKKNVTFIEVKNFTRSISVIKDLKAFFEVKKIIKEIKPDVIHLHSSKAGFIGRFAANGKKIRMLYNPHGFSFLMKSSSKLKREIYWWIEKIAAFRKCTIVGCSYGEYEEALKLTKNAICINNGIDIQKFEQDIQTLNKHKIDFENLKVCTSGRIGYQKNPAFFNKIAESFPNLQFTWIGDGELRSELTSKNIQITGWKSREEVLKIVNDNDIFILTSLWEGLPISLLEAMYLSKLCLVTDCIGNRDVIKNEENGFIINENNYQNIIKQINDANYIAISTNAKKNVETIYNIEQMINKYKKEYRGENNNEKNNDN